MTELYNLYKPWRNKIATLDRRESLYVLWAYSQALAVNNFRMPVDITVNQALLGRPDAALNLWEIETLAGEVILNGGEMASKKRSLRNEDYLAEIVQGLRTLENEIYGSQPDADVLIEMWRISHRQFTYQQKRLNAAEAIRYYLIYNDPPIDAICQAQLGLSVHDVFLIDMLFLGIYLTSPRQAYPVQSEIPDIPPAKIDQWLKFASADIRTVAAELKRTHKIDANYAYRYSPLRQYPILHQQYRGAKELLSPSPILVQWRVNAGLYFALFADPKFTNALGDSYQRFCGEVLRRALPPTRFSILGDASYGTTNRPRRTPDWIVSSSDSSAILIIECKICRPTVAAKEALTDLDALKRDFAKLTEGIVQLYERFAEYKEDRWPQLRYNTNHRPYLLVATLEDWFLLGPRLHELLEQMLISGLKEAGLSPDLLRDAPYAVISVNDLELLAQLISANSISNILDAKLRDAAHRTALWQGFLTDFARNVNVQRTLFQREYHQMFAQARVMRNVRR